ncbi:MAG: radical SAM family heme chaperone HemW [Pseudomonadota bacterium]
MYVHWPFCQAKCPYCDFNSHVAPQVDTTRWLRAYRAEIARMHAEIGAGRVATVFFGGGTPSMMDPALVAGIIDAIRRAWPLTNDAEITLEANPSSVEIARFRGYRDAGVTRISIGLQALRDADLKALGRLHSVAEGVRAVEVAQAVFDRVSVDLIYARQNQGLADWRAELGEAIALGTDHLSLYQLTIEDGTAFAARHRAGRLRGLPEEDLAADLFEVTQDTTDAAGLPAYEVSNHARTGAESRHNLVYWRGGVFLGIGPGAHGRLWDGTSWWATEAIAAPGGWLAAVETDGHGERPREMLSPADRAVEYILMGLRLSEGITLTRVPDGTIDTERCNDLISDGFLWRDGTKLGATARGRPVLNTVLGALLAA